MASVRESLLPSLNSVSQPVQNFPDMSLSLPLGTAEIENQPNNFQIGEMQHGTCRYITCIHSIFQQVVTIFVLPTTK